MFGWLGLRASDLSGKCVEMKARVNGNIYIVQRKKIYSCEGKISNIRQNSIERSEAV